MGPLLVFAGAVVLFGMFVVGPIVCIMAAVIDHERKNKK